MKTRLLSTAILASLMGGPTWAQEWKLDHFPVPVWAQPGETLRVTLSGPQGQTGEVILSGPENLSARLTTIGEGRYQAVLQPEKAGSYRLQLKTPIAQELGEVQVETGSKVFTANDTVITRQGPDSDFDRATPLVPGSRVAVDGKRGSYYRSQVTGAWLDGSTGSVADGALGTPRLTRVMLEGDSGTLDTLLSLSLTEIPETELVLHSDGPLTLTLPGAEHMVFDMTQPSDVGQNLGTITTRALNPLGAVLEIGRGSKDIGGYKLEPGDQPGELELLVRGPLPRQLSDLIITVDAGHGGPEDPGTVGHGGLEEQELNLRVAQALEKQLRERGVDVHMTRQSDADVASEEKGASHELQARVNLGEAAGSHLFLSLHHNARPLVEEGKISHGTDIYWFHPLSEPLARALADPIADAIGETDRTARFRSFHVIRQTFCPAVLIEFQYLSNPTLETNVLTRSDYAEKAAAGVVQGLEAYLRSLP